MLRNPCGKYSVRRALGGTRLHRAAKDAPEFLLEFVNFRERSAHAQPFGISGVDSGDEGRDETVQQFGREFATDERGDGFFGNGRYGLSEEVIQNREFRA